MLVVVLLGNQTNLFKGFLSIDITDTDGLEIDQSLYENSALEDTEAINLFATARTGQRIRFSNEQPGNMIAVEVKNSLNERVVFSNTTGSFSANSNFSIMWDGKTCGTYTGAIKNTSIDCLPGTYELILTTRQDSRTVEQNTYTLTVVNGSITENPMCVRLNENRFPIQIALNNLNQGTTITNTSNYLNNLITDIQALDEFDDTDIQEIIVDPLAPPPFPGKETTSRVADQLNQVQKTLDCTINGMFYEYNPIKPIVGDSSIDQADYHSIILDFFTNNYSALEQLEESLGRELSESEVNMLRLLGGATDIFGVKILPFIPIQLDDGAEFEIELTKQSERTNIDSIDVILMSYNGVEFTDFESIYEGFDTINLEAAYFSAKVKPTLIHDTVSNTDKTTIKWDGKTCANYGISSEAGTLITTGLKRCPTGKYIMGVDVDLEHWAVDDVNPRSLKVSQIYFIEITNSEIIEDDYPITVNWITPFFNELFEESDPSETDLGTIKEFNYNSTYQINRTDFLDNAVFNYIINSESFSYALDIAKLNADGTEESLINIIEPTVSDSNNISINWNELCGEIECNVESNYELRFMNQDGEYSTIHKIPVTFILPDETTAPSIRITEPDEDDTKAPDFTLELDTSIASVCKASLEDLEYNDDDMIDMDENTDDDEFRLDFEDIDEGETTIYVKCANKADETKIGEAEVTFDVEEETPDGDLECEIEADEDEFDPSTENIQFTYNVAGNSDVDKVDYILTIETESGTEVLTLKTDRNEELDLEDLTKDWNGLVDGDRLVDGDYKAVLTAEDSDDDRVTCTDEVDFELDDSIVDGIVLELEALNSIFEPTTSKVDLRLTNRVDGDRVVVNAYQTGNSAPIRTVFYQCTAGERCPESKGELSRGSHNLIWDGSDASGRFVAPGNYFFKASLKDDDDNIYVAFSDTVKAQGLVGGSAYPGGNPPQLFGSACTFTDVNPSDLDYQAVQWACSNGIFTGSNGAMNINQPLLRVDFIAVANRLAACPQTSYSSQYDGNLGFSDLNQYTNDPNTQWFLREIKNASRDCVSRGQTINGYPDGTIRINNQLIASEMWKVIIEAAKNGNRANYTFNANTNQNPWFIDYQALLQTNGVPLTAADQGMTRRDAIRLLHNMYLRGLIR